MAKHIENIKTHSLYIKNITNLLKPYKTYKLIKSLKQTINIPIQMHSHTTTKLSTTTIIKYIKTNIDTINSAISSISMTYKHSTTKSIISIFKNTQHNTNLNIKLLKEIATYFHKIHKKYNQFKNSLHNINTRILITQIPDNILTNIKSQLRKQNTLNHINKVLKKIPQIHKNLDFIPLITPTSQIINTQSIINILTGKHYKSITKKTTNILKGIYNTTPTPYNAELQKHILNNKKPITYRPADLLKPKINNLTEKLNQLAEKKKFTLTKNEQQINNILTFTLFNQTTIKFLKNHNNPNAFKPTPTFQSTTTTVSQTTTTPNNPETYTITVNKKHYIIKINKNNKINQVQKNTTNTNPKTSSDKTIKAPLSDNI